MDNLLDESFDVSKYRQKEVENELTDIRKTIRGISEALNAHDRSIPNATIPSDVFYNVFLPYFYGDGNPYGVNLSNWVVIASKGSIKNLPGHNVSSELYNPVDIVDSNNVKILEVPPIYTRDGINPFQLRDHIALGDLFSRVNHYSSIKPELGIKSSDLLFQNLLKAMGGIKAREIVDYLIKWDEIFTYYGRDSIFKDAKNLSTFLKRNIPEDTANDQKDNDDENYEFEDL